MKMTRAVRDERNGKIIAMYLAGASLEHCGQMFGLKRQRIQQIVRRAGAWRGRAASDNDRDVLLGIHVSEGDKDALRAEAARQGLSMSALSAEWIKSKLEALHIAHTTHGFGCPHDGARISDPKPSDCVCDGRGETAVSRGDITLKIGEDNGA